MCVIAVALQVHGSTLSVSVTSVARGITCKGMSEAEVLPGYFARADSAGFVWRCHGAGWAVVLEAVLAHALHSG